MSKTDFKPKFYEFVGVQATGFLDPIKKRFPIMQDADARKGDKDAPRWITATSQADVDEIESMPIFTAKNPDGSYCNRMIIPWAVGKSIGAADEKVREVIREVPVKHALLTGLSPKQLEDIGKLSPEVIADIQKNILEVAAQNLNSGNQKVGSEDKAEKPYKKMNKAELTAAFEARGGVADPEWTNAQLITQLEKLDEAAQ